MDLQACVVVVSTLTIAANKHTNTHAPRRRRAESATSYGRRKTVARAVRVVPHRSDQFSCDAIHSEKRRTKKTCACVHCMRAYSRWGPHFLLFKGCVCWLVARQALKHIKSENGRDVPFKPPFFCPDQRGPLLKKRKAKKKTLSV